jgi:hypothetical protein
MYCEPRIGIEPMTSALPWPRSGLLSYRGEDFFVTNLMNPVHPPGHLAQRATARHLLVAPRRAVNQRVGVLVASASVFSQLTTFIPMARTAKKLTLEGLKEDIFPSPVHAVAREQKGS